METFHGREELVASLGRELGPGEWLEIGQDRIDGFADVTGDHQWIHVDPERAAGGPFGATVAHGFLTLSLVPLLLDGLRRVEGTRMGLNYGLERVRFPSAVRSGTRVRARSTLVDATDVGEGGLQLVTRVTIEVEGSAKPACVADLVTRAYF
ncbi:MULTISPECIES: MaoC family dehydratase [Actinomycetospora]|jgi:acyl dehydratase|uniref:MaoC family dehydratase n=2 Tax=Actinomycetospora TaxID=402649 RepID=A0ABP9DYQ2_9PSEU|nr:MULTISPECIES: MaoC family dehydratase [Actinomycetospora]MDD7932410.1 MaoC family dehydratase [Actinomycetospora straminea]MDD7964889.1 MaoC family dehydratase [Actinomycetospora sp. DW7H6]